METKSFEFEIITRDKVEYTGQILQARIPGTHGYFGVQKNHIPLMSLVGIGRIDTWAVGQYKPFATSGGFAHVYNNKLTIIVETAEAPEEIDEERAKKARDRAKKRLKERRKETDFTRAEAALRRAYARLDVIAKAR